MGATTSKTGQVVAVMTSKRPIVGGTISRIGVIAGVMTNKREILGVIISKIGETVGVMTSKKEIVGVIISKIGEIVAVLPKIKEIAGDMNTTSKGEIVEGMINKIGEVVGDIVSKIGGTVIVMINKTRVITLATINSSLKAAVLTVPAITVHPLLPTHLPLITAKITPRGEITGALTAREVTGAAKNPIKGEIRCITNRNGLKLTNRSRTSERLTPICTCKRTSTISSTIRRGEGVVVEEGGPVITGEARIRTDEFLY